jgi:hypothetical protein
MSDAIPPPLSQGTGYGVIVGLGFAFAIGENLFQPQYIVANTR